MADALNNNSFRVDAGYTTVSRSGLYTYDNRLVYSQVTQKDIVNTVTKTLMYDDTNCIGSRNIPANFSKVGTFYDITHLCLLTNTGNPTNIIDIDFGSVSLYSAANNIAAGHTDDYTEIKYRVLILSIGINGTCMISGSTRVSGDSSYPPRKIISTTPITINTTIANEFKSYYTWGTADASNKLNIISSSIISSN